jgi:hypothetical protein
MPTEPTLTKAEHHKQTVIVRGGGSDTVYALGVIGACMYYLKGATTFEEKARAFGKALVWPVFLVKGLFEFLEKEITPPGKDE